MVVRVPRHPFSLKTTYSTIRGVLQDECFVCSFVHMRKDDFCYCNHQIKAASIVGDNHSILHVHIVLHLRCRILSLSFLMLTGHTIQENGGTVGIRKINKRKIEVKFASLLTNVRKKLREKQINSEDLSFLANSIFLREYIPKSSSVNEIFEIMNHHRLWDYWNYYLLEEFIHFATDDPEAKAMVETYRQDLDSYKVTKTIIDHVDSFNETPEEKGQLNQLARYDQLCYKNLSMKIQMNFTDHSLKYIDDLWNRYANLYGLPPHVALLDHIQKGCFSIVWLIPSHLAAQICDAAPPLSSDFYRKHEITRVEIDGRCIYDEEEDCHDIHHVHVDKERDEEPVAAELQGNY